METSTVTETSRNFDTSPNMAKVKRAVTTQNIAPMKLLADQFEHWELHGDWEPMAYILTNHAQRAILKRIVNHVTSGHVHYEIDKKAKYGARFTFSKSKKNAKFTDKKEVLIELVAKKVNLETRIQIREDGKTKTVKAINHHFPSLVAKPKVKTVDEVKAQIDAYILNLVTSTGMTESALRSMAGNTQK